MTRRALLLVALLSVPPEGAVFISCLAPAVAVAAGTLLVLSEAFDGRKVMAFAFILCASGSAHPVVDMSRHPSRRTPN
jgi:hypothetical protein